MIFSMTYALSMLLILFFFLIMRVDSRLLIRGGSLFYANKIFALGAIFSATYAIKNEVFGFVAVVFFIFYIVLINFYLRKRK